VANYLVRLRVTTHVTVAIVERLPLPNAAAASLAFARIAALARHLAEAPDDLDAMATVQALAAHVYELDAEAFEHILGTFPLVDIRLRDAAMASFLRTI
jgi:hypothetical protein